MIGPSVLHDDLPALSLSLLARRLEHQTEKPAILA